MHFLATLLTLSYALYPSTAYASTTINSTPQVLLDIASCESGQRQFNDDGSALISPTADVGAFQINKRWYKFAKGLGYDIYTEEGNLAFALWLYHHEGTRPWLSSKPCWHGKSLKSS